MTLKVIGAGFGRTGTVSLKLALEQLGFGPCYHMTEVFPKPEAPAQWLAALNGAPDWESIFAGYNASVDWPSCHFWREQMDYYPGAKVILSVRDAESWFASTQQTIFAPQLIESVNARSTSDMPEMLEKIVFADAGGEPNNRARCIEFFERHNATVKATVPADRLLVFEAAQGWAPLCKFLGVGEPDAPYPKTNSTKEFQDMQKALHGPK